MIQLKDDARAQLEEFFAGKDKSPIRIFLGGGCSGARLALALDTPGETDSVFEQGGFTFCIDTALLDHVKGVDLFMSEQGFEVQPHEALPEMSGGCGCGSGGGGGCGSGASSGGCGSGGGCCSQ